MALRSKKSPGAIAELAGADDAKIHNIMDEVDRFFKSVHADIEDWKFSMEDYGDGTRIFVRFQIHINNSGTSPSRGGASAPAPSRTSAHQSSIGVTVAPGGRTLPDGRVVTEDLHVPDATGSARRADQDLASFVEVWRGKQENKIGGEFHKPGAPYVDAKSEWKGHTRTTDEVAPRAGGKRNHEDSEASLTAT
jgi:hypothetical protein